MKIKANKKTLLSHYNVIIVRKKSIEPGDMKQMIFYLMHINFELLVFNKKPRKNGAYLNIEIF